MTAGEALVFWLGGFSSDPKYPISGEGGPSYRIRQSGRPTNREQADPIDSRKWIFPFEVARLQPRDARTISSIKRTTASSNTRSRSTASTRTRRINFWQYVPAKSEQPYLYFDTSRHPAAMHRRRQRAAAFDPPAATAAGNPDGLARPRDQEAQRVGRRPRCRSNSPIADKFQILHCGIDDEWGEDGVREDVGCTTVTTNDPTTILLFPDGPFTGDVADTIVNFSRRNAGRRRNRDEVEVSGVEVSRCQASACRSIAAHCAL